MLVFGDHAETADPNQRLSRLETDLATIRDMTSGWTRHDALVGALICAGMLAQAIADEAFEARGEDDLSPLHRSALDLAARLGGCVATSWRSRFRRTGPEPVQEIERLRAAGPPRQARFKTPEGFAVYAVYPEAYSLAASRIRWREPPLVVGLRSIGTCLAATAADGARSRAIVSLRPSGDPFRRQVRASSALQARFRAHAGEVLIVDEGPGLSGSSFGAAADFLEGLGVAERRLVFMPSHGGDIGSRGSPSHRARWRRVRRTPAVLEGLLAEAPIQSWFVDVIGPVLRSEDLSAGAWRNELPPGRRPPAWRMQERRKFRLTTGEGVFIARFAGLGEVGARKLVRARALHAAGFAPEPLALRGGFLLERWIDGEPLSLEPQERGAFIHLLGAYLGFRARQASREPSAGDLTTMTLVNAAALGGASLRSAVGRALEPIARFSLDRPVEIDGRLHPWEWRRDGQGRIWKTDAIDHCCGHDLVGSQDISWDLAGANVEFGLNASEAEGLRGRVAHEAGYGVRPEAVRHMELAYCAFQAGLWTYAAEDPEETEGASARASFYADHLRRLAGASV